MALHGRNFSPETGDRAGTLTGDDLSVSVKAAQKALAETQTMPGSKLRLAGDVPDAAKDVQKTLDIAEPDSEHVDVGAPLSWSQQAREKARPKDGQGYYDVMKSVGTELLGRDPTNDEVLLLVDAAKAMQENRGKNPNELTTHDELLPKNEEELNAFMNGLANPAPGKLSDHELLEFKQNLNDAFLKQRSTISKDQIIFDTKPVKDQPVVTKVVPDAVYIDSSNIEGGQGYRRKETCEKETQEYWLKKSTAEAFMRAQQWLIKNGDEPILLNNMNAAGRRAIDRELISKCAPDQPHAKKHSQHEDGISIDVSNYDDAKVRQALTREGFVHNVPGDRPHFTWFGNKK